MRRARGREGGNAVLEFTLVGIPMIFVLISVVEISRGMWTYHTLAHAMKEGVRYAVVHGRNCELYQNTCQTTVGDVVSRVSNAGVGLVTTELQVDLIYISGTDVNSIPSSKILSCATLQACMGNTDRWPAYPDNQVGSSIMIRGTYPFRSAVAVFWPGAKGGGVQFGVFNLPASSMDTIQF